VATFIGVTSFQSTTFTDYARFFGATFQDTLNCWRDGAPSSRNTSGLGQFAA